MTCNTRLSCLCKKQKGEKEETSPLLSDNTASMVLEDGYVCASVKLIPAMPTISKFCVVLKCITVFCLLSSGATAREKVCDSLAYLVPS